MGRFANSDTRDPAVNVTNWFLIVVVVLSVLIRLGTKYWIFHKLTSDDYLIIASLAFCIAQSAAISTAVSHGYGYHFATISSQNFEQVMKVGRLTICRLHPVYRKPLPFQAIALDIHSQPNSGAQRSFPGSRSAGADCGLGGGWRPWYGLSMSSAPSMGLLAWAMLQFGRLELLSLRVEYCYGLSDHCSGIALDCRHPGNVEEKGRVCQYISSKTPIAFSRDVRHSTDPTYDYCPITIASQVVQCASIVTACWGQLKPFLNQLKSNGLRIQGVQYQYSTGKGQSSRSYGRSGTNHSREEHHELVPVASGQNLTTVSASPAWDADSQSSQTGIIRETRTWVVTGDEGHPEHR
ncbi:conserved hypothetical protein [Aspergillus fumigatus A1163]|uniref:Rhodopsin domain-containing protein n=1 Tax=Aspergillus fumigatus (strain CBS 144.89 / FGSC A1163 / CEA10) TaxID=451804 RepID=B0Y2M4_ASPFC|nr:conserved hypothetical protein [Aspergillus fumigatus A1163]